jgi:ornithine decarboxylase
MPVINRTEPADVAGVSPRIKRFLKDHNPPTPCLIVDLDIVADLYRHLETTLPETRIFYAVKANPATEIIRRLVSLGSRFDVASPQEVDLCLEAGARPEDLSYGNTIKKRPDITYAYERGVRIFAFDAIAELEKIAELAPGSSVYCRILTSNEGAEWPLSRKFGCEIDMAAELLLLSRDLGLRPTGVVFHVGSQQRDPNQWNEAIGLTARLFRVLEKDGVHLSTVNLGGGFPSRYRNEAPPIEAYGEAIMNAMHRHFEDKLPEMIVEPGRYVTGDAGVIHSEVVLVSWKHEDDDKRWVYLDVGIFGGLAEAMDEAIKYRIIPPRRSGPMGPVVIAGPTCDSVDILYEHSHYELPLDLQPGDTVDILSAGAYTTTYSSVGFNGLAPLAAYCI